MYEKKIAWGEQLDAQQNRETLNEFNAKLSE